MATPLQHIRHEPANSAALDTPSIYVNSELSLLRFQRRVLEEARDSRNPLMERVKFLAILSSNLDEFFMVRVAGLLQQIESGAEALSIRSNSSNSMIRISGLPTFGIFT